MVRKTYTPEQIINKLREAERRAAEPGGVYHLNRKLRYCYSNGGEYNQVRPHSSLGYRPPAPEARLVATLI